jgi:hypothetical protein
VQGLVEFAKTLGGPRIAAMGAVTIALIGIFGFLMLRVTSPHIAVRVNDALYAAAKEKLEDIVRAKSFEGRLMVLAEPDIAVGDCRIEWADGGINRDSAAAEAAIGAAVAGYVSARRNAAATDEILRRSEHE